jgi:hypothetical protein
MGMASVCEQRARTTNNSIWILGWIGDFDKLAMTRRIMAEVFSTDIEAERQTSIYLEIRSTTSLCSASCRIPSVRRR